MAVDLNALRRAEARGDRRPWHGAAFIVESLVLLAFLMASLAVLMQVMGGAHERGVAADELSNAIVLASNDAEAFAANPVAGDSSAVFGVVNGTLAQLDEGQAAVMDAYEVVRTVEAHAEPAGTRYDARIDVRMDGESVYAVETSRYVSDAGVAR